MKRMSRSLTSKVAILAMAFIPMTQGPAVAEPNQVTFPDLDALEHYTTVTRGSTLEHMLTTPEAIAAVKAGEPIPYGTHVVLVHYVDGDLYRYFVMQNGEGWADDQSEPQTPDWAFQWFWPDQSINMEENTARCRSCHESREGREYMYTYNDMRRFEQ